MYDIAGAIKQPEMPFQLQGGLNQLLQQRQQQQLGAQQIQEGQMNLDQRRAMNSAYHDAIKPDASGNMAIDTDALTRSLAANGHGSAIPGIIENINKYKKSQADLQESQSKLESASRDSLGYLGGAIQKAGYDPHLADLFIQQRLATPGIPQQEAQQLQQMRGAMQQNPQMIKTLADNFVQQSPKMQELASQREQADARGTPDNAAYKALISQGVSPIDALAKVNQTKQDTKPDTAAQEDQRYEQIIARRSQRQFVSAADGAWAMAYQRRRTLGQENSEANKGSFTPVYDADNNLHFFNPKTNQMVDPPAGMSKTNPKPTADEQKRADLVTNLNENLDQLEDIVKRRPELFGKVAGRETRLKEWLGSDDTDVAALKGIEDRLGMVQQSSHGMRSAQHVEASAQSVLNGYKNGADAMLRSIADARKSGATFTADVAAKTGGGNGKATAPKQASNPFAQFGGVPH